LNYSTGVCQGLKAVVDGAYHFFIIGYLPDRQGTFQLCAIPIETRLSDTGNMKILPNSALVLEKK
jgi:hypothetical protein